MASSIRESWCLAAELLVDFLRYREQNNYSCLALMLKSKPRLKPRRYTDGTSRVLPFPIPLYSIYDWISLTFLLGHDDYTYSWVWQSAHVVIFGPNISGRFARSVLFSLPNLYIVSSHNYEHNIIIILLYRTMSSIGTYSKRSYYIWSRYDCWFWCGNSGYSYL